MIVLFVILATQAWSGSTDEPMILDEPIILISVDAGNYMCCGVNEQPVACRTICPPQSCDISYTEYQCSPNPICEPGCDCIENYLRNDDGICIYNEDCTLPSTPIQCGEFEEPIECPDPEPNDCDDDVPLNSECEPGCKCIDKYVRDSNGECVPTPPNIQCGINEEPSHCKKVCPPQWCGWSYEKYACKAGPCQPGCNCIRDYLRNDENICVPKDQCTPSETPCIYDQCTPTCSVPNPPNCPQISARETNRCNCAEGYILSEKGGQCVKLEECQKYLNCDGDRNATYQECPNRCKSTCSQPNPVQCDQQCKPSGCQCNPLYILSDEGKCISPDDCPGGNPCRQNETFIYCNVGCPTNYCPVDDSRSIPACGQPYPCPSGCACQRNYRRKSLDDDRCILASDCPPVKCTRQYEVWNSCPPPCFSDSCKDLNRPSTECVSSGPDCQPQCVCEDGYRRNNSDICVPVYYCPAE